MEEKNYTVYCHENKTNRKRYIGITCQNPPEKRWGSNGAGYLRNPYFMNSIKKYGWKEGFEHIILFQNITKTEAESIEQELILKYKSYIIEFGYNIKMGGNLRDCFTEQTRMKISKALSGRTITREQILKTSVPIVQLSMDGDVIKFWLVMTDASDELNISLASIWSCCNRRFRTAGGFIFLYEKDYKKNSQEEILKIINLANIDNGGKTVVQLTKEGEFISRFKNISEAHRKTNTSTTGIVQCCKRKLNYANKFIWMYLKDYENMTQMEVIDFSKEIANKVKINRMAYINKMTGSENAKLYKEIVQLDLEGSFIKKWISIKLASESLNIGRGHISSCCTNKRKKTGGYKWMYYKDYVEKYGKII